MVQNLLEIHLARLHDRKLFRRFQRVRQAEINSWDFCSFIEKNEGERKKQKNVKITQYIRYHCTLVTRGGLMISTFVSTLSYLARMQT